MQRFAGSKSSKAEWVVCVVLYAAMVGLGVFGLYDAWKHHSPPTYYAVSLLAITLSGGMGALSIPYLLKTFAVYEADDAELIQRGVLGIKHMRWRDIAQLNERSGIHD